MKFTGGQNVSPVTLVLFLGGVTYAEIAAVRFFCKKLGKGLCDVIIGTTDVITGDSLIQSLIELDS